MIIGEVLSMVCNLSVSVASLLTGESHTNMNKVHEIKCARDWDKSLMSSNLLKYSVYILDEQKWLKGTLCKNTEFFVNFLMIAIWLVKFISRVFLVVLCIYIQIILCITGKY